MATPPPDTRLYGRRLALARLVWIILVSISFVVIAATLPTLVRTENYTCPADPCYAPALGPADLAALPQVGLSLDTYTDYFTLIETLPTLLAFLGVGLLIFWRRSDDWMAILTSLFLLTFIAALSTAEPLGNLFPWNILVHLLVSVGPALLGILFYLFPNGRFAPGWMKWFALAQVLWALVSLFIRFFAPELMEKYPFGGAVYFILLATAFGSQVYRFLRVSTPLQRQQTKWVVMAAFMMPFSDLFIRTVVLPWLFPTLIVPGPSRVLYNLVTVPLFRGLPFILVPVSFGVAILRYRLWDIDVLIRRTLVYSLLTGSLALVYLGSVVLLQGAVDTFLGGSNSPAVTVLSTLAVAALFTPMRRRIQGFIDRRFYRHKYNAEQVLTNFSATLRDEVDLDRLSGSILGVVEETMQPEHLSLWVRETGGRRGSPGGPPG